MAKKKKPMTLNSRQQVIKITNEDKGYEKFLKENGLKIDGDTKKAWGIIDRLKEVQNSKTEEEETDEEKALLEEYKKISKSRWSH